MKESEVVPIMKDIFEALAYLHSNGVAHRDIKPQNVRSPLHQHLLTSISDVDAQEPRWHSHHPPHRLWLRHSRRGLQHEPRLRITSLRRPRTPRRKGLLKERRRMVGRYSSLHHVRRTPSPSTSMSNIMQVTGHDTLQPSREDENQICHRQRTDRVPRRHVLQVVDRCTGHPLTHADSGPFKEMVGRSDSKTPLVAI